MNCFKKIGKKILYKYKASSDVYISYLRSIGVVIGENVEIFNPRNTIIDEQYPWMITIGNNVKITDGVKILTHDFSWSVIKNFSDDTGKILGASGNVSIGNNVFIGMDSVITRNVKIGDNVIIGGGSIVTHDCESGYVYAGNPAMKLMSIQEYIDKREKLQIEEAKHLALEYIKRFGKKPSINIFFEYFALFMPIDDAAVNDKFLAQIKVGGTANETIAFYHHYKRPFETFEQFMEYCTK